MKGTVIYIIKGLSWYFKGPEQEVVNIRSHINQKSMWSAEKGQEQSWWINGINGQTKAWKIHTLGHMLR